MISVISKDNTSEVKYNKKKLKSKPKSKIHTVGKNIIMFSTNAAGIVSGKAESLVNEIEATGANIVTIQETHSTRKGTFVVFESIRPAKHGGTMCAVHEDLKPKLVEEYNDPFELIVEIETKKNAIRVITGCGPQENWEESRRVSFFIALEAEIV